MRIGWLRLELRIMLANEVYMMKRGVGYCMNTGSRVEGVDVGDNGCEDYAKGVFLLNHGDNFYCPRCRVIGLMVKETGKAEFSNGNAPFKEVRCEFNYDPCTEQFREIAIVRDEAIWGTGSKYTLMSPLIKTEKRALKVAEAILANLQRYSDLVNGDEIPRSTEVVVSFDEDLDVFTKKLHDLGKLWEESTLAQAHCPGPPPVPADPAVETVEETKWELPPEQAAEGA
jgi:ribosomal protein S27AE